jgi:hypothetical protein
MNSTRTRNQRAGSRIALGERRATISLETRGPAVYAAKKLRSTLGAQLPHFPDLHFTKPADPGELKKLLMIVRGSAR